MALEAGWQGGGVWKGRVKGRVVKKDGGEGVGRRTMEVFRWAPEVVRWTLVVVMCGLQVV